MHNKYLLQDAVELADFEKEKIKIVGMPHFDYYVNEPRLSTEELCNKIGADPKKKILFFLMIGMSNQKLDEYITSILENWLDKNPSFKDFQLIVRPHPNTNKLINVGGKTIVNYPKMIEFGLGRLTDREFTKEDIEVYASLLAHARVIVSYQGTGLIDAAALDKPMVAVVFDETKNPHYLVGIKHQYEFDHLQSVLATGGIKTVYNEEELKEAIMDYSLHPEHDSEARKKITEEQCFKLDGKASLRVIEEIKESLKI